MRATTILPLLLAVALAASSHAREEEEGPRFPRWRSGEQEGTVTIDGHEEAFVALVPRGFTQKRKWPVVLLAHGNGGKAKSFLTAVKPTAGRRPPLLVSLERCDNNQDAIGYVPKYLAELRKQFNIDDENVFALGFSGGGFRLWDDVVCKAEVLPDFRGVVLVGCGKQSFDPPEKPEKAPTIVFVGDPRDPNYGKSRPAAADKLRELGYEVIVHEHNAGHSLPRKQMKAVFEWIAKVIRESRRRDR
jgi:predicted esterase